MKFMTAASVKNLPNYLLDDRKRRESRLLERERAQQKEELSQQKKQMSEAVMAIAEMQRSGATPEQMNEALPRMLERFDPEAQKFIMNGVQALKQQFNVNADRQIDQNAINKETNYQSIQDSLFGKSPEEVESLLNEQPTDVQRRYSTEQESKQQEIDKNISPQLRLLMKATKIQRLNSHRLKMKMNMKV